MHRRIALLLWAGFAAARAETEWLPYHAARVGQQAIAVQVAEHPLAQQRGLMGRTALPPGTGMLFVYKAEHAVCFWMRNTPLPLDIAFADRRGRIHTVAQMRPSSDERHCAGKTAYALEVPQGWLAAKGIGVGDAIRWPLP